VANSKTKSKSYSKSSLASTRKKKGSIRTSRSGPSRRLAIPKVLIAGFAISIDDFLFSFGGADTSYGGSPVDRTKDLIVKGTVLPSDAQTTIFLMSHVADVMGIAPLMLNPPADGGRDWRVRISAAAFADLTASYSIHAVRAFLVGGSHREETDDRTIHFA
jgi:hypothetical protein